MKKSKPKYRKISVIVIFFSVISLSFFPSIIGINSNESYLNYKQFNNRLSNDQELDLLYGEIAFYIITSEELDEPFNISYSLPPNYLNQAPIIFEIRDDTTAEIISYKIVNDTNPPNIAVEFNIAPDRNGEFPFVHFDFWVLVKNDDFNELPGNIDIPSEDDLSDETKIWLVSTKAVQSDNILIKLKAKSLKGNNQNLILLADKTVKYTHEHRMRLILWMLANMIHINYLSGWAKFLDAVSSLFFGGSCTGRANLGTALLRANDVPARILHVMPTWSWLYEKDNNFWFDMHYISDYYCPDYGWIPTETTLGLTPFEQKNNIILRINYPEDENVAGKFFDYYGGCEQWFWTESKSIRLYWNHNASGARSLFNNNLTTDQETASVVFNTTQKVYDLFSKYEGVNLTGLNLQHFKNATIAQRNAVDCFIQEDINCYNTNINLAFDEYQLIILP